MTRRAPSAATADDVLRYVAGYLEARDGVAPRYLEIGAALGIHSKHKTHDLIYRLQDQGKLRHLPRRHHALAITAPVTIPRAPDGQPLYFVRLP